MRNCEKWGNKKITKVVNCRLKCEKWVNFKKIQCQNQFQSHASYTKSSTSKTKIYILKNDVFDINRPIIN